MVKNCKDTITEEVIALLLAGDITGAMQISGKAKSTIKNYRNFAKAYTKNPNLANTIYKHLSKGTRETIVLYLETYPEKCNLKYIKYAGPTQRGPQTHPNKCKATAQIPIDFTPIQPATSPIMPNIATFEVNTPKDSKKITLTKSIDKASSKDLINLLMTTLETIKLIATKL